jgi:hypothetical protein
MLAALGPSAMAYINGGDFHNTLERFEKNLKSAGWGVSLAAPLLGTDPRGARGTRFVPPDNPEYQSFINQLVGQALQALSEKERAAISSEAKREVARLVGDAIRSGFTDKRQTIRKGQAGILQYQAGAVQFETYWETNYDGKRKTYERHTGLSPFVALKVVSKQE